MINIKLLSSFLITVAAIGAMIAVMYYAALPANSSPEAAQGELDLSDWSFGQDGSALLNGQWEFYSGKLLEPDDIPLSSAAPDFARVPSPWGLDPSSDQPLRGNATYRLSVLLPPSGERLAIKVQNIWMSHRLYINGVLMKEMGAPSEDETTHLPANTPYLLRLEPVQQLDIVLQVSNYLYVDGGIVHPIQLGEEQQLELETQMALGSDLASFLLFLLIGIFHLTMYQMRKKETVYLFSGLYLVLSSFIFLTSGEKLFMRLLDGYPFEFLYKCQDLFNYTGLIALIMFIRKIDSKVMRFRTAIAALAPVALFILFVVATPYSFYINFKNVIVIYILLVLLACIIRLFYILLQKQDTEMPLNEFIPVTASISFVFVMVLGTILYYSGYINTSFVNKVGLLGFLITLNLLLARRFTNKMNEVQSLSGELQKSNAIKDEFLARTSHELKTPLHGIINIADHLLKERHAPLTGGQREHVALIHDTSAKLSLLVNDLIDAIKLRHEDLKLQSMTVDLYVITQVVFQLLSFSIEGKDVQLINRVKPMTFAQADENRLRQILYNLIANAAKYTERGTITARAYREGESIVISITDTGAGIPQEQWEDVFNDSYRHAPARKDSDYGMGLGLFISRQLARRMEGNVWIAQSIVGEGTTVNVRLPHGKAEAGESAAITGFRLEEKRLKPSAHSTELKPEYDGMLRAIATAMFSLFDYLRIVKLFISSRVSKTGQPTFL